MRTINLQLANKQYPILIGQGLLDQVSLLQKIVNAQQVMLVSNTTVANLYLPKIQIAFANIQCDNVILPDGEEYKTLASLNQIFDALIEHKHHRSTTLIALGGGVIGDMTGFAAACYQRGVGFIQIPTTLLAQVDASIGGKTAVNHPMAKNMIGAFYQPNAVLIDVNTLRTLPDREFCAGLAEIIKAALIADKKFFHWLQEHSQELLARDTESLIYAIEQACRIKAEIVMADEREQSVRALLNLGHTFGHAIEQLLGYGHWLHGEAVSVGLVLAADLSYRLGLLSQQEFDQIKQILIATRLPTTLPYELEYSAMLDVMLLDKKTNQQGIRFVLIKGIGQAELVTDVPPRLVGEVISANRDRTRLD